MKKRKKAQIQLGESTAVVIVIIILVFLGLVVYFGFWKTGQGEKISKQREVQSINLALTVSYLPELHCTFLGRSSSTCFDAIKASHFQEMGSVRDWQMHYFNYFGYAKIELIQVYPNETKFTIYDNQKGEAQSESPIFIPVNIYDPITDKNGFGYLNVTKIG